MITAYCGLDCDNCTWREPCHCSGCIATSGKPFHGPCVVAECCKARKNEHCGLCEDFPCKLLTRYSCDPEHGDTPPGARVQACCILRAAEKK